MGERPRDCSDPRGVNQRKGEHLRKNRGVVRMPDEAERTVGNHAQARGIHDLNIPMIAQGADDPPTDGVRRQEDHEHHRGQCGDERALQKDHFDRGADQDGGMQQDHPAESRFVDFGRATRDEFLLVEAGDTQLDQAQSDAATRRSRMRNAMTLTSIAATKIPR